MQNWANEVLQKAEKKIRKSSNEVGAKFAHQALDQKHWGCENVNGWTNGYWPALLWMMYDVTNDEHYKNICLDLEKQMDANVRNFNLLSHDIGFMYLLCSKPNYDLFKDEESKKRLLYMANCLAGRFNIKGNFIRAWEDCPENPNDVSGWAIIDCTMNIPLLFWASKETGDPRFYHIAKAHADNVVKYFCREDGSVNHICEFNKHTGEFIRVLSGQGYSETSAWARGQSWAIHGLALAYNYTNDEVYLDAAKRAAIFFTQHLPPDSVPYWDITAPVTQPMPRDASAGANAASGMLEIAKYCDGEEKEFFQNWAIKILKSLYENYFLEDMEYQPLLRSSTIHKPAGYGIDIPLIYADYYFIEAIRKLQDREEIYLW